MNPIKITVIIPIYNVEQYLEKCITSIINQTLKEIEIICINDGSTDNSLYILQEFCEKDTRIKIINQENQGPSVARNFGIESAQGEYIYFVDSDDWININTLSLCYETAKKNNADIVIPDVNNVYNQYIIHTKRVHSFIKQYKIDTLHFEDNTMIAYQNCYAASKLHKKSFITQNNIKFPTNIKNSEDTIFWFKELYCNPRISLVKKDLYYYRKRENSLSSNSSEILETLFESYKQFAQSNEYKNTTKSNQILTFDYFGRIAAFIYSSANSISLCKLYEKSIKKFLKEYKCLKIKKLYKLQGYRFLKFRQIYTIVKKIYLLVSMLK